MNSWATPRWVTGSQTLVGTPTALVTPGTTVTGTPARQAGQDLLGPPAEDERVTALEPSYEPARPGPVDQCGVDLLLGHGPAVGDLADVDDLDVRGQLVEQRARGQSVGEHHVGFGEQLPAVHRRTSRDHLGRRR